MNSLASPWRTWKDIYEEYLQVKDDDMRMRAFINTVLGETFVLHLEEQLYYEALFARREDYGAELHPNIKYLTAGVDVQDNRLEVIVVGWGEGYENYVVQYRDFGGNPAKADVWLQLDDFLKKKFTCKNKKTILIAFTLIDSGGHHTGSVYKYVYGKEKLEYAVKKIKSQLPSVLAIFIPDEMITNAIEYALNELQVIFKSQKRDKQDILYKIIEVGTKSQDIKKTLKVAQNLKDSRGYVEGYAELKSDFHGNTKGAAGVTAGMKL